MNKNYFIAGILFILASFDFIISELIAALFTKRSLLEIYTLHTISELGIPFQVNNFSPFYNIMNSAFIIVGILLLVASVISIIKLIKKQKILYYIFLLITSVGMIIIAIYHAGHPYHAIGALMALMGGSLMLIITSKNIDASKNYKLISMLLGIIGVVFTLTMIYFMSIPELYLFKAIPERICVYSLLLWSFMSGIYLIRK